MRISFNLSDEDIPSIEEFKKQFGGVESIAMFTQHTTNAVVKTFDAVKSGKVQEADGLKYLRQLIGTYTTTS